MTDGTVESRLFALEKMTARVDKEVAIQSERTETVKKGLETVLENQAHILKMITTQAVTDERLSSLEEWQERTRPVIRESATANRFWKWIAGGSLASLVGLGLTLLVIADRLGAGVR